MRRPIVIAPVLAVLLVLVALGLRAASVGDDDRAAAVAERYGLAVAAKDVRALCGRLLSSRVTGRLQTAGYPCEPTLAAALADVRSPTLRVLASDVDDDGTARVRVDTGAAGQERTEATLVMREEGGGWRISSLGDALGASSAEAGAARTREAAGGRPGAPPAPPLTPGVVPLVTVPQGSRLQDGIVSSGRLPGVPSGPVRPTGRRGDRNDTTSTAADEPSPEDLRRAREEQGERDGS